MADRVVALDQTAVTIATEARMEMYVSFRKEGVKIQGPALNGA
jgi:hypothetical protein